MAKSIPVETEEWCPDNCSNFVLGSNVCYTDADMTETYYFCENAPICRNAVANFNKWRRDQDLCTK